MKHLALASLASLLLCSACSTGASDSNSEEWDAPRDGAGPPLAVIEPTDVVCDPNHQIAYFTGTELPAEHCGSVGPWVGQPLFDGPGSVPSVLQRYCQYTFSPGDADASDVGQLGDNLDEPNAKYELGADCRAVSPQGSAIADEIGTDLDAYFGWLSGRITPDDVNKPQQPVHTAVVDTYPRHSPDDPNSKHGPIVSSIIESFVCPSGTGCAIDVRNYLGLPRTETGIDTDDGGLVGRQTDLAKGVLRALWAHDMFHSGNLVINLSVAWEAEEFHGMDEDDLSPPVRAVYDVLRIARCQGALIIAAAGNESQLSCLGEAMAPARWEEIPAPTGGECDDLGISNPSVDPAAYTPLVHAIGGLYGRNTAMTTSRAAGMPRLAAASSHAVAHPRAGLRNDEVRTGTSIGTAVASATASLVWSYDHTLSPSEVMERLYESGDPVGTLTADFPVGGALPVHRVDACKAVEMTLSDDLGCDSRQQPVTIGQLANQAAAAVVETAEVTAMNPGLQCENACGEPYTLYPQTGSIRTCTTLPHDPWSRLTSPQPVITGCQECILTTESAAPQESNALVTVISDFAGYDVKGVDIEVFDDADGVFRFNVAEKDLINGAIVPKVGEITEYDLPIDLEAVVPVRAKIYIYFIDPDTDEIIETVDTMLLRVE